MKSLGIGIRELGATGFGEESMQYSFCEDRTGCRRNVHAFFVRGACMVLRKGLHYKAFTVRVEGMSSL